MEITVGQIAAMIGGIVEGDDSIVITGPSKIEEGEQGTITFLSNPKYEQYLYKTNASAALVRLDFRPKEKLSLTLIKVDNVQLSVQQLMNKFVQKISFDEAIAKQTSIHESSTIGKNVHIGEFSVVSRGASIDQGTSIYTQVYIGEDVKIGKNCTIYPGVKLMSKTIVGDNCIIHSNTVLGADGFGFSKNKNGEFKKIPQIGNVVIEDNVEIGGSCVIDRATMGTTLIKKGVKLDNLVHIAHNVVIDKNTAIAGQCGIAGSAKIGKDVLMGGQVGVAGHIKVADGTQIQAKSGIAGNIKKKNTKLYGYPAIDYGDYLRAYAGFKQLPSLLKRIQDLEKKIGK